MKHHEQVLNLLNTQIGNPAEVKDISDTAKKVADKWVNPVSGGKESINGLVYGLVQSGKTGVLSVSGAIGADEGYRTIIILTSDNDALYRANHPGVCVLHDDIRGIEAKPLRESLGLQPGELDLLAGCPPCQGFSSLRTRNGSAQKRDHRNGLIREMIRFTRAFLPKAIMMENVPGLAEHWSFRKLCRDLRKLGYKVKWDVKDARHYGVPQRRKRLILIAGRGFDIALAKESSTLKTVRDAFANLRKPGKSRDALQNLGEQRSAKVLRLIKSIPKDGGSRSDLLAPGSWNVISAPMDLGIFTGGWLGMRRRRPSRGAVSIHQRGGSSIRSKIAL